MKWIDFSTWASWLGSGSKCPMMKMIRDEINCRRFEAGLVKADLDCIEAVYGGSWRSSVILVENRWRWSLFFIRNRLRWLVQRSGDEGCRRRVIGSFEYALHVGTRVCLLFNLISNLDLVLDLDLINFVSKLGSEKSFVDSSSI